jgi:D-alanyl-D-alanine carboxypeptidase
MLRPHPVPERHNLRTFDCRIRPECDKREFSERQLRNFMRLTAAIIVAVLGWLMAFQAALAGPTLLFEVKSGKVLYSEDPDSLWHPASLTKIMTAYLAFKAIRDGRIKLDQKIPCSLVATLQPPSKVGLNVGAELTVEKALQAVIVKSANDVTVMLAEAISGSEGAFVAEMNATAKKLGMTRTSYVNTNGLPDPGQISTARDIAKLARTVVTEFPEYASYWTMTDMHIGKRRLGSHNALLKTFPGADGLKTGFTCDSGYNIVASATRDDLRLMVVVLGEVSGKERAVRSASLLEHGFQTYGWKQIFNQTTIDNLPFDKSASNVTASVRDDVAAWSCGNKKHKKAKAIAARKKALKARRAASKKVRKGTSEAVSGEARPALKGTTATPKTEKASKAADAKTAN